MTKSNTIAIHAPETFFRNCEELADLLIAKKKQLHELLQQYETYNVVEDEINRSTITLRGMHQEIGSIKKSRTGLDISTFFPLNLPLYSLTLFGIAPSVFGKNVFIRPPEVMFEVLEELWRLLEVPRLFPNISLKPSPRHIFVQLYAADSDVIIFTGKYENALEIHEKCPSSLLIYNGSGINPFILFEDADVNLAIDKAIEMRCFNSGQDCAGPDAFFVPSKLAKQFNDKLINKLKSIKVGSSTDPKVIIGPIRKVAYIDEIKKWLKQHDKQILYGGKIDVENNLVYPTLVFRKLLPDDKEDFHEFFAPYFYVLEYSSLDVLKRLLLSPTFKDRGMYASIFGSNSKFEKELSFVRILKDVIINDVEYGNQEYGGYGTHANFIMFDGKKDVHPILISRDIQGSLI